MKTTIEMNGYQIVIEETEGTISVSAVKDEEVVEEFTLELEEGGDDDLQAFGDEEDDFEGGEEDLEGGEDFGDEDLDSDDDYEGSEEDYNDEAEDDVEEEGKLESFNTFVRKRK